MRFQKMFEREGENQIEIHLIPLQVSTSVSLKSIHKGFTANRGGFPRTETPPAGRRDKDACPPER